MLLIVRGIITSVTRPTVNTARLSESESLRRLRERDGRGEGRRGREDKEGEEGGREMWMRGQRVGKRERGERRGK